MIRELTGRHVLTIILLFFGTIFVANGFLVYFSQSTWTGLETQDAYRKGVKFNQQLSEIREQNDRGWSMDVLRTDLPDGGVRFTATPLDQNRESLSLLNISVELIRPTHEGMDQTIELKESALGVYTGETAALPKGKWYVVVTAKRKDETMFRSKNELYLR